MTDPTPTPGMNVTDPLNTVEQAIRWLAEVNGTAQAQTDGQGRKRWAVTHPGWFGITGPDLLYCCKVIQAMVVATPVGK